MSALAALLSVGLFAAGLGRAAVPASSRALRACLGLMLAAGAWSASYGAIVLSTGRAGWPLLAKDLALAAVGAALLFSSRPPAYPGAASRASAFSMAAFALAAGVAALVFVAATRAQPDGDWDAFLFWNLRARFFVRDAQPLARAFDAAFYQLDYPLLLPGLVAQVWALTAEARAVPALVAALFAASCAATLFLTLRELRESTTAALAAALLCATPVFALTAASQYADVPLAALELAGAALCALALERRSSRALVAAGFAAGLAAWTKNEGALYLVCLLAAVVLRGEGRSRRAGLFALGAALPLLLLAAFKARPFIPRTDLLAAGMLERAADPWRWLLIVSSLALRLVRVGDWGLSFPLLLAALVAARLRGPLAPSAAVALGSAALFLLGSFAIFAATPHPPAWQLRALDRLLLQLWPSLLLGAGLAVPPAGRAPAPPSLDMHGT